MTTEEIVMMDGLVQKYLALNPEYLRSLGGQEPTASDLALLLAWGLVGENRKMKGLARIPLLNPGAAVTSIFQSRWPVELEPASDLVGKAFSMRVMNVETLYQGEVL